MRGMSGEEAYGASVNYQKSHGGGGLKREIILGYNYNDASVVALAHDVTDYDFIVVTFSNKGDIYQGVRISVESVIYDVKSLIENGYAISYSGYKERNAHYTLNGNILTKLVSGAPNENPDRTPFIVEIIGYKF